MPLRFLRRNSGSKKTQSLDVVAQRFCQIFQDHGVERSQIPRLMPQIKLGDLKSNEALLAALTPEILDQTAHLLGIRSEWLEGVDNNIYAYRSCYKAPGVLLELLATLRNSTGPDSAYFPMRVLVSNKHLDYKADREQLLVPVVLEKITYLGEEPIYRYTIFNDGFNWKYEPARIQLKAMVRVVCQTFGTPVPLMVISPDDLQSVLDCQKISRKFLERCLITDPSLEDFVYSDQESRVAAEVEEMPKVLKYIEEHQLESFLTPVSRPASPTQVATTETPISPAPPTPATIPPKTGKRAENNARWEAIENAARTLWSENGSLTISEMVRRIQKMPHLKAFAFASNSIHKRIAHLAPGKDSSKSGRRPKKST